MFSIDELKKQAAGASDLSTTMNYFFRLAEELSRQGIGDTYSIDNIKQDVEIQTVLKSIADQIGKFLQQEVKITNPIMLSVAHQSFYHGFCSIKDNPIPLTFFYFSDIKSGMFAFTQDAKTELFRFALIVEQDQQNLH